MKQRDESPTIFFLRCYEMSEPDFHVRFAPDMVVPRLVPLARVTQRSV